MQRALQVSNTTTENGRFEADKLAARGSSIFGLLSLVDGWLHSGEYKRLLVLSEFLKHEVFCSDMAISHYCVGEYREGADCAALVLDGLKSYVPSTVNIIGSLVMGRGAYKSSLFNVLGYMSMESGDYKAALKFYNQALTNKNLAHPIYNIYQVRLYDECDIGTILQEIDALPSPLLFTTDEEKVYALHVKGFIYHQCLKYEQALDCFNNAIAIEKTDIFSLSKRGFLFTCQGRFRDAMEDFDLALSRNPNYSGALAKKGYLLTLQGQFDAAIRQFDRSLEINSKHFETLLFKAFFLIEMNRTEQARGYLNATLSISVNRVLLIAQHAPVKIKEEVILHSLQFNIQQNNRSLIPDNKADSFLRFLNNTKLFSDLSIEIIKSCIDAIKEDLEQLNGWLSRVPENSLIHVIVSDIVLKNIKGQQLQRQQNDAYFISSSVELKRQLERLVFPNDLESYKNQAMEHVRQLVVRHKKRVDDLNALVETCLEPPIFLISYSPGRFFGPTKETFLIERLGAKVKELDWALKQLKTENDKINRSIAELEAEIQKSNLTVRHRQHLISKHENLCQLLQAYNDVCKDLAAIREIYISYKGQLSNVYNSKPSDEREQELKLMCEPRYILRVSASRDYLCEKARLHLAPKDGEAEVTESEDKFGTHIVRQYGGVHFKYHMQTAPCYPAVEYMVGSLYNMLAGASYGIAPTEIIKLYRPECAGKPEHAQVLVASQSVEGINLHDFLLRHVQHYPRYLQQIDLYSFSAMVITSLLSNPADGKPDNYMVSFIAHENGDTNEDNFKVKIVGIDNDLSFASPIIKQHKGERTGQHFVEVQSVFYFFPQMQEKMHPKLIEYLISQSAELLFISFIKTLQTKNQEYEKLKEDGLLIEEEWNAMGLPICFPSNDSLVLVYQRLMNIQSYLSKNRDASHAAIFENLYPGMFTYYQQIASSENNPATTILDKFCKLTAAAAPSLEEAGIIMAGRDRRLTSKIALKTMLREGYLDRGYALSGAVEEFVKALDFAKIPSIELQRTILETLKKLNCIKQLTLRNCQGLDDGILVDLSTSLPTLKSIHLVGCPNVTIAGVLATYNINIFVKKLIFGFIGCGQITSIKYQQMADMQIPLELLAKDSQSKYYGFPWSGNANTILHQILSQSLNQSLSIEQMRFLIAKGLDINSHNDGQTSLNGYTALHIAAVNKNLKMLGLLLALGANQQKLDKHSQETPFQKAAKRKLFMPCYALSQAQNSILTEKEIVQNMAATKIQNMHRARIILKL